MPFKGKGAERGHEETETLEQWIESLALPFKGIRNAKRRIEVLEQRQYALGQEAEQLRVAFRAQFPRGEAPAYLARDTDKTLTPLRWRVSTAHNSEHARKRFEFGSELGQTLLGALPPTTLAAFLNAEIRRIHLNQAIVTTTYELERLRRFVQQYTAWRRLRDAVKAGQAWRR